MHFIQYTIRWIAGNLSIPFWMVGHVHLSLNVYEDIYEIITSVGMNILVAIGFYLEWKEYKQQKKMNKTGQMPNMKVDLKTTTKITTEDNRQVFQEGVILRKVSKFISGTEQDGVVPIPCFYEPTTGKVLVELLPKELQEEFKDYNTWWDK